MAGDIVRVHAGFRRRDVQRWRLHSRALGVAAICYAARYCCGAGVLPGSFVQVPTLSDAGLRSRPKKDDMLESRRELFLASLAAGFFPSLPARGAFTVGDIGYGGATTAPQAPAAAQDEQTEREKLQEALYLISRVQEATVQEERLVTTGKFKDVQRNNIRMALNMMVDNYRLNDQLVTAAKFVEPKTSLVQASQLGSDAVEALQTAQEYFAADLKVNKLSDDQRKFLQAAMSTTRSKLESFISYMPTNEVAAARRRVEDENEKNAKEFAGELGAMINPVTLPWKQ
mmetsp:Transcript_102159/g.288551  ORF Transcript_102159/g.288551 Transcript_102159/m.288551 type:complete len:286 (-) Transcript_102159:95-952(-)